MFPRKARGYYANPYKMACLVDDSDPIFSPYSKKGSYPSFALEPDYNKFYKVFWGLFVS